MNNIAKMQYIYGIFIYNVLTLYKDKKNIMISVDFLANYLKNIF